MDDQNSATPAWPSGDNGMAVRIRGHDWAATALGPIDTWPQTLVTTVGVLLALNEPAALAWGPEFIIFYNDAYVDLYGDRDQAPALGVGVPLARPEIWGTIGPDYEQVLGGGGPVRHENRLVPVLRHGRMEDIYWTYSFNPVLDAGAARGVGGVLILAEQRVETTAVMRASDERQLFLSKLSDSLRPLADPEAIRAKTCRLLGDHLQADWVVYGQIDVPGDTVDIDCGYSPNGEPPITGEQRLSAFGWTLPSYKAGITVVVSDTQTSDQVPAAERAAMAGIKMTALISVPLLKNGELVGALAVSQAEPRTWTEGQVGLVEETAERIWEAIERARAESALRESEGRLTADLAGMRRLYELHAHLAGAPDFGTALDEVLDAAVTFTNTDRGTIQLISEDGNRLEIVRDRGYPPGSVFVEHFRSAGFAAGCDAARTQRRRLIIEDTSVFPGLVGTADGEAAASSGVRAAQSTPMISRNGEMIGILSTQFRDPHRPTDDELRLVDLLAWTTAEYVSRHRADRALRESEARFRLMADAAPLIVWITDRDGRLEFFNRQWADYIGVLDVPPTAGDVVANYVHPDDAQRTMEAFEEARASGGVFSVEHRIRRKDGVHRWFLVRAEPYRDPHTGEIVRWFGASIDIDDRRAAEAVLNESQAQKALLLNLSDVLRPLNDPPEIIAAASEALGRHLGVGQVSYAEADLSGEYVTIDREWNDGSIPSNARRHRLNDFGSGFIADLKQGRRIAIEDVANDPRTSSPKALATFAQASLKAFIDIPLMKNGRLVAVLAVHSNVPRRWRPDDVAIAEQVAERIWASVERAEGESALKASEERFRSFAETSTDTLWIADAQSDRFEYLSPAYERMWGEPRDAVMADPARWPSRVHPDDRIKASEGVQVLKSGRRLNYEYRIVQPDGSIRYIHDAGFPIMEDDKVRRVAGVAQDLTDRRLAERALAESERRARSLVEGLPQLVWRAIDHGKWTWASPQWTSFTGQPEQASHGRGWLDTLHPDDRDAAMASWRRAVETGGFDQECRIRRADGKYVWFATRATPVRDEHQTIVEWLGTSTEIHAMRELQERQSVLVAELQHRTRNLIAVVQSLAGKTVGEAGSIDDFEDRFGVRLAALSRVQGLLSHLTAGQRVSFDELLGSELSALGATGNGEDKVTLDGPAGVWLRSATVQTFALALHELATNAMKYGALSAPTGRLTVRWRVEADGREPRLHVDWRERGVDTAHVGASYQGGGYGRELIERALPYQLKAETTYELGAEGVHCTIAVPIASE